MTRYVEYTGPARGAPAFNPRSHRTVLEVDADRARELTLRADRGEGLSSAEQRELLRLLSGRRV